MRRIYLKRTEHIDNQTGEITHSESQSSYFVKSRHFVKCYLDHIHLLKNLSGGARYLLDLILIDMEFNTNAVYIGKRDRDQLAKILQRSEHTIRNYLYELESEDILAKTASNIYRVNPNLFSKGDTPTAEADQPAEPAKPRPLHRHTNNHRASPL